MLVLHLGEESEPEERWVLAVRSDQLACHTVVVNIVFFHGVSEFFRQLFYAFACPVWVILLPYFTNIFTVGEYFSK